MGLLSENVWPNGGKFGDAPPQWASNAVNEQCKLG
jgi:hypothetical protein